MQVRLETHNINNIEQTIVVIYADEGKILHRKGTTSDFMESTWLIDNATPDDYEELVKEN